MPLIQWDTVSPVLVADADKDELAFASDKDVFFLVNYDVVKMDMLPSPFTLLTLMRDSLNRLNVLPVLAFVESPSNDSSTSFVPLLMWPSATSTLFAKLRIILSPAAFRSSSVGKWPLAPESYTRDQSLPCLRGLIGFLRCLALIAAFASSGGFTVCRFCCSFCRILLVRLLSDLGSPLYFSCLFLRSFSSLLGSGMINGSVFNADGIGVGCFATSGACSHR